VSSANLETVNACVILLRIAVWHICIFELFVFIARQQRSMLMRDIGVTPCWALNTGGVEKICDFLPISRYISQTIQNIAIVTMEGE